MIGRLRARWRRPLTLEGRIAERERKRAAYFKQLRGTSRS